MRPSGVICSIMHRGPLMKDTADDRRGGRRGRERRRKKKSGIEVSNHERRRRKVECEEIFGAKETQDTSSLASSPCTFSTPPGFPLITCPAAAVGTRHACARIGEPGCSLMRGAPSPLSRARLELLRPATGQSSPETAGGRRCGIRSAIIGGRPQRGTQARGRKIRISPLTDRRRDAEEWGNVWRERMLSFM